MGSYEIFYTISLENYPLVAIDLHDTHLHAAFKVTIISQDSDCTPDWNAEARVFDRSCTYEQLCSPVYIDKSDEKFINVHLHDSDLAWFRNL